MDRRRFLATTAGTLLAACTAGQGARPGDALRQIYARPGRNEWPEEFLTLPVETQAMYRYAVANRETLRYIPCFCGCVNGGHTSNLDCYVREAYPEGRVRLDTMSFARNGATGVHLRRRRTRPAERGGHR